MRIRARAGCIGELDGAPKGYRAFVDQRAEGHGGRRRLVLVGLGGWQLLQELPKYVSGAQVQSVRALEKKGLATIEDNGDVRVNGRADGERWHVVPTELARAILARVEGDSRFSGACDHCKDWRDDDGGDLHARGLCQCGCHDPRSPHYVRRLA